jgi:hypothetical protein
MSDMILLDENENITNDINKAHFFIFNEFDDKGNLIKSSHGAVKE